MIEGFGKVHSVVRLSHQAVFSSQESFLEGFLSTNSRDGMFSSKIFLICFVKFPRSNGIWEVSFLRIPLFRCYLGVVNFVLARVRVRFHGAGHENFFSGELFQIGLEVFLVEPFQRTCTKPSDRTAVKMFMFWNLFVSTLTIFPWVVTFSPGRRSFSLKIFLLSS